MVAQILFKRNKRHSSSTKLIFSMLIVSDSLKNAQSLITPELRRYVF